MEIVLPVFKVFWLGFALYSTLGIGFLWLIPYMNVSAAKFYDDIKDGTITTEVPNL